MSLEPKIAQKGPYVQDIAPGTYAWCACGGSKNQPFCDGSHRGSGFQPVITKIDEARKVAWCGCKHSGKKPFCDGTHNRI